MPRAQLKCGALSLLGNRLTRSKPGNQRGLACAVVLFRLGNSHSRYLRETVQPHVISQRFCLATRQRRYRFWIDARPGEECRTPRLVISPRAFDRGTAVSLT